MAQTQNSVGIAVLTYRRPEDLAELLPRLDRQIAEITDHDIEIVIVDNDPDASAHQVVDEHAGAAQIRYVHEPRPGISSARNRALDECDEHRLLIFIDDDERPLDEWLSTMLRTWQDTSAAAVTGPVYPDYAHPPEEWLEAGAFFVRKTYPDGQSMPAAGSGNLLLDLDQVRRLDLRFDERFSMTGGSDTLFTRQLIAGGGKIVYAASAGVVDKVPEQRMTREWVLQRRYRVGNSWSRTAVELAAPGATRLGTRLMLTGRGGIRIGYGVLRSAAGKVRRSAKDDAMGLRAYYRGLGMVAGAWGGVYVEYRRKEAGAS